MDRSSMTTGGGLHVVAPHEADLLGRRAEALRLFLARYRHNPGSQQTMYKALARVVHDFTRGRYRPETFEWEILVAADITGDVWGASASRHSRATALRDASALRVMLNCLHRVGLLSWEQYQAARAFETKNAHGYDLPPAGRYLSEADVAKIVEACQSSTSHQTTRVRDTALVLTFASTGCRGVELTGMRTEHLYLDERRVWLAHAKGGRQRDAWLHPAAVTALDRWLDVAGRARGPLFAPLDRAGKVKSASPLSGHQVWKIVRARAAAAGFPDVTPHDFRRFVISTLLSTHDLTLVCKVAGHANPATTARYDRRPAQGQRDAIATIDLPTPGAT